MDQTSVLAFFREQVIQAMRSLEVPAEPAIEAYLANLLASVATEDRLRQLSTPFVELLAEAVQARGAVKARRMRSIGDAALVVSGYFSGSMEARGISHTYVEMIGSRAYRTAASDHRFASGADTRVLVDLASRFRAFTRVVDEVREQTTGHTDQDTLKLYERWVRTDSAAILRRLTDRGLVPVRFGSGSN